MALLGAVLATTAFTPRAAMRRAINEERADRGCAPLSSTGDRLIASARAHSRAMREAGYIFHSDLDLNGWDAVGEVVGVGESWRWLFEALMDSPEHRRIMMDCRYDRVAIGFARDPGVWVTGRFYDG